MADLLENPVMPYAWGSRTAIAALQGRETPSPRPEAELWMGAHPVAPSRLIRDGVAAPLDRVIARDPSRELGETDARRFGGRLPFMLKVLAAAEPLSLQAHPNREQAEKGFAREEALGVPLDAPHRNYRDRNHKPELLCALTPFDALCGFRQIDQTLLLFDALGVSELDAAIAPLRWSDTGAGFSATILAVMTRPEPARSEMVAATLAACREHADAGPFASECRMALALSRIYPDDPGIITALLLNLVRLEPGEAIYLGAGRLHAYLGGAGVEIMASSDNVLRGGLTRKHVDLDELLSVLDFADGPVSGLRATPVDAHEVEWMTPAPDFRLSRISLAAQPVTRVVAGPEILLCTEGRVEIADAGGRPIAIERGGAAFVAGSHGSMTLRGEGTLFRATPGPEVTAVQKHDG